MMTKQEFDDYVKAIDTDPRFQVVCTRRTDGLPGLAQLGWYAVDSTGQLEYGHPVLAVHPMQTILLESKDEVRDKIRDDFESYGLAATRRPE